VVPDGLFTAALVREFDFANQDLAILQPHWHFPAIWHKDYPYGTKIYGNILQNIMQIYSATFKISHIITVYSL